MSLLSKCSIFLCAGISAASLLSYTIMYVSLNSSCYQLNVLKQSPEVLRFESEEILFNRLSWCERYNFQLCFIRNQDGGMKGWEAQTTNDIICQALCLALRNFKPYPVWLENQDFIAFKPSHECDKRQHNYTRRQLNSRSFSRMRPYSYASLKLGNLPCAAVTRYTPLTMN